MDLMAVFRILITVIGAATAQFIPQLQFQYQQPQIPMQQDMPGGFAPAMPPPMLPGISLRIPPGMSQLPQMPGMLPQMHMGQLQLPMPGGRLPMVVMPRHTKNHDKKKPKKSSKKRHKRLRIESSLSKDSNSYESELNLRSKNNLKAKKGKRRRQVLTPVVSYVTNDGYVVYQKKIRKDKAKDWLEMSKMSSDEANSSNQGIH